MAFDAKKTRLSVPSTFRAVLAQTGDGDVDTVVAALKAGADDYVIKGTCSATPLGKRARLTAIMPCRTRV